MQVVPFLDCSKTNFVAAAAQDPRNNAEAKCVMVSTGASVLLLDMARKVGHGHNEQHDSIVDRLFGFKLESSHRGLSSSDGYAARYQLNFELYGPWARPTRISIRIELFER